MEKVTLATLESLRWPSWGLPEKRRFVSTLQQESVVWLYKELVERVLSKKTITKPEKDTLRALEEIIPSHHFQGIKTVDHEEWVFLDGKTQKWYSNIKTLIQNDAHLQ